MLKKLFFSIVTLFFLSLSFSYGATRFDKAPIIKSNPINGSVVKIEIQNEIYYVWVLMDNGCFYLFRVEVVGGILEFWTPMGAHNFVGSTVNCIFQEEMDSIC